MLERQAARVVAFTKGGCHACYLIDYGTEIQGGVNLSFVGVTAGHQVTVQLSEELDQAKGLKVPQSAGKNSRGNRERAHPRSCSGRPVFSVVALFVGLFYDTYTARSRQQLHVSVDAWWW